MTRKLSGRLEACPECGCVLDNPDNSIPRSPYQHKAFYRMVGIALDNWPESHPDPESHPQGLRRKDQFEYLRAWLLCEVGHRARYGAPWKLEEIQKDATMLARYGAAIAVAGRVHAGHVWPKVDKAGNIHIVHARSIAFDECSHEEFRVVFDLVQGLIEATLDIKITFDPRERKQLKSIGIER